MSTSDTNLSARELQAKWSKLEGQEDLPYIVQQVSGGVENRAVDSGYPSDDGQLVKLTPTKFTT